MSVITIRPARPATVEDYSAVIEGILDSKARERRYDNSASLATYVGSTNTTWAAEAAAFVRWRDAVWAYAHAEFEKVASGLRPQPSMSDFLANLPTIAWPKT